MVGISKGEANALLVLIPLLFSVIVFPPFFNGYFVNTYTNNELDQAILDSLLVQMELNQQKSDINPSPITLSKFDPNTASIIILESNGIPSNIANRIINYRKKGGSFKEKGDLKKIYGFQEELYLVLAPFIEIAESDFNSVVKPQGATLTKKKSWTNFSKKTVIRAFDVNKADTTILKQIYGIGSKLSVRIINFRDRLGGFISSSQLHEVYGLETEVVDSLTKYGDISTDFTPIQININTDTIQSLSNHPYINYRLAKSIINYHKQHGNYKEVAELKKIHLINDSIYHIISPYLKTFY